MTPKSDEQFVKSIKLHNNKVVS